MGLPKAAALLSKLDELYPQPDGKSVLLRVLVWLNSPMPPDNTDDSRYMYWDLVDLDCRTLALAIFAATWQR